MATRSNTYVGINNDVNGAMTTIGKIIRDAWVFGILPETETCEGWNSGQIDVLLDKVNAEWDKYGCMVGQLPAELRKRHQRIHDLAISKARSAGWSGEHETADDR